MTRPILLDLYCGAGGATRGYQLAGFDVMGVDINPQPDYCGFDFVQTDALEFLQLAIRLPGAFAAIHASPPCQRYTTLAKGNNANEAAYPDLIGPTRELLEQTGLPYVIENVPSAPLLNPVTLWGDVRAGCDSAPQVRIQCVVDATALTVEADDPDEAIDKACNGVHPFICHQCAREIDLGDEWEPNSVFNEDGDQVWPTNE